MSNDNPAFKSLFDRNEYWIEALMSKENDSFKVEVEYDKVLFKNLRDELIGSTSLHDLVLMAMVAAKTR